MNVCDVTACPYFESTKDNFGCNRYRLAADCHLKQVYPGIQDTQYFLSSPQLNAIEIELLARANHLHFLSDPQYYSDIAKQEKCPELGVKYPTRSLSLRDNRPSVRLISASNVPDQWNVPQLIDGVTWGIQYYQVNKDNLSLDIQTIRNGGGFICSYITDSGLLLRVEQDIQTSFIPVRTAPAYPLANGMIIVVHDDLSYYNAMALPQKS